MYARLCSKRVNMQYYALHCNNTNSDGLFQNFALWRATWHVKSGPKRGQCDNAGGTDPLGVSDMDSKLVYLNAADFTDSARVVAQPVARQSV